jgi:hypothetical protein
MARKYFLTNTSSDLGGGSPFNNTLEYYLSGSSSSQTISLGNGASTTAYGYTLAAEPGVAGGTGDYEVTINVSSSNNSIFARVSVTRVNSSGTAQSTSSETAEQAVNSTGVITFNLSSVNLGTFAAGDRLRVNYIFRNSAAHSSNSCGILLNDDTVYVTAPFRTRYSMTS